MHDAVKAESLNSPNDGGPHHPILVVKDFQKLLKAVFFFPGVNPG